MSTFKIHCHRAQAREQRKCPKKHYRRSITIGYQVSDGPKQNPPLHGMSRNLQNARHVVTGDLVHYLLHFYTRRILTHQAGS